MSESLEEALCRDFPLLFANMYFECGDGWEPLLRAAATKIEAINKQLQEPVRALQIKEKFGTLRFYVSHGTEEINTIIREAENASARTCETCGQPGKLRGKRWVYTACEAHNKN